MTTKMAVKIERAGGHGARQRAGKAKLAHKCGAKLSRTETRTGALVALVVVEGCLAGDAELANSLSPRRQVPATGAAWHHVGLPA